MISVNYPKWYMETVKLNVQNYTCIDFHWDGFQMVRYMFIVSFASMKKSALEEEIILISSVIQLMSEEQYSFFLLLES